MNSQTTNRQRKGAPPSHIAYHIPDRENAPWTRIGAAWATKDGKGFRLSLDLAPISGGTIMLRVPDEPAS